MKKIEAYKLDNGEIIEDKATALAKEACLKSDTEIESLCDKLFGIDMDVDDLADVIKENKRSFRDACRTDINESVKELIEILWSDFADESDGYQTTMNYNSFVKAIQEVKRKL